MVMPNKSVLGPPHVGRQAGTRWLLSRQDCCCTCRHKGLPGLGTELHALNEITGQPSYLFIAYTLVQPQLFPSTASAACPLHTALESRAAAQPRGRRGPSASIYCAGSCMLFLTQAHPHLLMLSQQRPQQRERGGPAWRPPAPLNA